MLDPTAHDILQIRSEETVSADVLHLRGELDMSSAPSLRHYLVLFLGRARPIIVDCSELQYIDVSGIHALEDCERSAAAAGQRLVLVASTPIVHKVMIIVQLHQRMRLVDTLDEAMRIIV